MLRALMCRLFGHRWPGKLPQLGSRALTANSHCARCGVPIVVSWEIRFR